MQPGNRWMLLVVVASLQLSACARTSVESARDEPARVEEVKGTDLKRVILSERAIRRLDVRTAPVLDETARAGATPRTIIPYAAVLYDPQGNTWAYTNPRPRTFVRHPIRIDAIEGDVALLSEGPPAGTAVVTVGVAELFGVEYEVGH